MLTEKQQLKVLTGLGITLNRIKDLDVLLERILTEARLFTNADAGSIYVRDGDHLHFRYTQNATLQKRLPRGARLLYSTFTVPISPASLVGYCVTTGKTLNIADAYAIDVPLPYRFARSFDEAAGYRTQSILVVPLKTLLGDVIGALQIINAQDRAGRIIPFLKKDERMMLHFASVAAVAMQRAQMTRDMILRMIRMAELRDPKETGAHVNRVAAYALEIYEKWARSRRIPQKEIEAKRDLLRMAAMLHDVGKVAVSDLILKKPGRLTPEEFEIMKQHALVGARLFDGGRSDFDQAAAEVSLNHHERWDGAGYPGHIDTATGLPLEGFTGPDGRARGKRGEEIPLFGRIVAIADVFDALSSRRVYKEACGEEEVLEIMREASGRQFDPELLDLLFQNMDAIRAARARYPEEDAGGA